MDDAFLRFLDNNHAPQVCRDQSPLSYGASAMLTPDAGPNVAEGPTRSAIDEFCEACRVGKGETDDLVERSTVQHITGYYVIVDEMDRFGNVKQMKWFEALFSKLSPRWPYSFGAGTGSAVPDGTCLSTPSLTCATCEPSSRACSYHDRACAKSALIPFIPASFMKVGS